MKKKMITMMAVIAVVGIGIVVINGCSKSRKKGFEHEKTKSVFIGNISSEKSGTPTLGITMPEIVSFMQENNKFVTGGLIFHYNNAWITKLSKGSNETEYYLSVGCLVKDRQNNQLGDCYTIFIPLIAKGDDLLFAPPGGTQHSCTGHCCSSCQLYPADDTHPSPYCSCETPSTVPSCQGEARCDHSMVTGGGGGN